MFDAISKTLGQSGDPKFRKVVFKSILGAIAVFILTTMVIISGLQSIEWTLLPFYIGDIILWMGGFFDIFGGFIVIATIGGLVYFTFPIVMTAVMGIFLDEITEAVDNKHYPHMGDPRESSTIESILTALKFLGFVLLVNLIALPFYLLTFWFGLGFILYFLVNGYLLGREFFEQVAHRRLSPKEARIIRQENMGMIMLFGLSFVILMFVPILNLIVPILATATMAHIFYKMRGLNDFNLQTTPVTIEDSQDIIEHKG